MGTIHTFEQEGLYSIAARYLEADRRQAMIRVLVVDDHLLFAQMLTLALETHVRFEVVGHARNGAEAVELAAWLRPDLILMDLEMPVLDGIEATRRVRAAAPGARVVIVSSSDSPEDQARAREAGAVAYLTKQSSLDDLVSAVELVVCPVIPLRPGLEADASADLPTTR